MNPKPTNTMKHHDMLYKSTDVNFKKVITRSSSKGSDAGMGLEEMDCGDEVNEARSERGVPVDSGEAVKSMNGVVSGDIRSKEVLVTNGLENVAVKEVNKRKGVSSAEVTGNVSDMFPELSSTNLSKKSNDKVDIMHDIPVPIEPNPLLNPVLNSGDSRKVNSIGSNVSKGGSLGKENTVGGDSTNVQGMNGKNGVVGDTSGTRDVEMQENNKTRKPMLFSNIVQGASYATKGNVDVGSDRIVSGVGTPIIMDRVTTSMCEKAYGRASFARVLIEVDANKGLVDSVEVWYRKMDRSVVLKVDYVWKPPICSHCCVFGHSYKSCVNRVLTEEERVERAGVNMQVNDKATHNPNLNDGWQNASNRSNNGSIAEPVKTQVVAGKTNGVVASTSVQGELNGMASVGVGYTSSSGANSNRNGMYYGRGGASMRGTGGLNGRWGYGGANVINERRTIPGKNSVREKMPISEGIQKKGKENVVTKAKENQVKNITQKNFSTNNRYEALANVDDEDTQNELLGIRVNIDVAVEMGISIDKEERENGLRSCKNIMRKMAEDMVEGEMEATGVSRGQAFGEVYDSVCKEELKRIHELTLVKQLAEVELFVVSEQPFTSLIKESWTEDMIEFYENRFLGNIGSGNMEDNVSKSDEVMVDEVGNDTTAHASFIIQNNASSSADAAMAMHYS
ncbi:hypothetical protein CTI12_AA513710 [Artemisia annua]|uniref:Zinc knuckle CX2CX4HX4C n=1 Tax=Artemisia annua TaxID=35608 RepID=A0A2U1L9A1_ARTAN|nr:hypothetical protein CTI12_AA513710 [Artemisia annua]